MPHDPKRDPQPGDWLRKATKRWLVTRFVTAIRHGDRLVAFREGSRVRSVKLQSWRAWARNAKVERAEPWL